MPQQSETPVVADITEENTGTAHAADSRVLEHERQMLAANWTVIIDRLPIGCLVLDRESIVTHFNPGAERIFGFTAEEVVGKHPFETIVPAITQKFATELLDRLSKGDMFA